MRARGASSPGARRPPYSLRCFEDNAIVSKLAISALSHSREGNGAARSRPHSCSRRRRPGERFGDAGPASDHQRRTIVWPRAGSRRQLRTAALLRRQLDGELSEVALSNAVVRVGVRARLLLGVSGDVPTSRFRRSRRRARGPRGPPGLRACRSELHRPYSQPRRWRSRCQPNSPSRRAYGSSARSPTEHLAAR